MSAFTTVSKFVAEEYGIRELHSVPSQFQAGRLKLLSAVEDGNIKEWTLESEDLPFELEEKEGKLSNLKINSTKEVDGKLRAELGGFFDFDLKKGRQVSCEADFEELAWKKLQNTNLLIEYLQRRKYSTSNDKRSSHSWRNCCGLCSDTRSFKVVTCVLYTTSPTKITLTYKSELGATANVNAPIPADVGVTATGGRRHGRSKEINLPGDTPIAYGYVDVFVCKNGKMKVKAKDVCEVTLTLEQPSSTSAGPSGDASSAVKIKELEQKCAEKQEKVDKLEQEQIEAQEDVRKVKEEKAEIEEELNRIKQENSDIQQENDLPEELIDQSEEEKARLVPRNDYRKKELTATKEMLEQRVRDHKIQRLEQQVAEKVKIIDETNKRIDELEAEFKRVNGQIDDLRTELEDQKKKHASDMKISKARPEALETFQSNPKLQVTTTKTAAVVQVPEGGVEEVQEEVSAPVSVSVEPKSDRDERDYEDEEVPATESESAVAKVGQVEGFMKVTDVFSGKVNPRQPSSSSETGEKSIDNLGATELVHDDKELKGNDVTGDESAAEGGITAEAVVQVPDSGVEVVQEEVSEPVSGSVEPKSDRDETDDEDEEVPATESEGAVAKVGQDLLSASKFPAMKGKPKLVIVEANSGGNEDYGDARPRNSDSCVLLWLHYFQKFLSTEFLYFYD